MKNILLATSEMTRFKSNMKNILKPSLEKTYTSISKQGYDVRALLDNTYREITSSKDTKFKKVA